MTDSEGKTFSALEVASEYFRSGADKVSIGSDAVDATEEYFKKYTLIQYIYQLNNNNNNKKKKATRQKLEKHVLSKLLEFMDHKLL